MSTIVLDSQQVHIPAWVEDLETFRRWAHSQEFPENGRICFLNEVWVDMSKEQFTHPRGDDLEFIILRHGGKGYVSARKHSGWHKSSVFAKSFQLTRENDALGFPAFNLTVR